MLQGDSLKGLKSEWSETRLLDRRKFLSGLCVGLGGVIASILGLPVVGFLVSPLVRKPPQLWRQIGPVEQYQLGATTPVTFPDASPLPCAGVSAKTAAWLRRQNDQQFVAFLESCQKK